ncbi:hypothetical protein [Methanomethylovorans sp.]|uniref:hypothetical protein n=1 Tax=Methanomethylovorans sp. TaxID=2758717 RepID=UPI00351BF2CD
MFDTFRTKYILLYLLERQHVYADGVIYIGKKVNNIEEQALDVDKVQVSVNEDGIKENILALTPEEARKLGIKLKHFCA